MQWPPWRHAS
ncbi:hypothetical protein E2C01_093272 [Portunus trituberculatus]|uniref:Uncharacterized protein n=1 Tax=Portunus trituberculatus TaxID=210409 RepID=A0A5B7JXN4_PORTR|nr:hypothetical protein [Portunus trituberculatus]